MPATAFENLKSLLKVHPEIRPITRPNRTKTKSREATDSLTRPPAADRHRRKCQICHHPYRREIEADFLRWRSSAEIARDFGIADHSAICRHARATGLRDQRQRTVAYALHPILEQAEDIFLKTTASTIVSAVRTYAQINDEGRRLRSKPVTNIYITNESAPGTVPPNLDDLQFVPGLKQVSRWVSQPRVSGSRAVDVSRRSPVPSEVEEPPACPDRRVTRRISGSAVDVSRHSSPATSHCLSNRPIPELEDDSTH